MQPGDLKVQKNPCTAGVPPRTPLGKLTLLPKPLTDGEEVSYLFPRISPLLSAKLHCPLARSFFDNSYTVLLGHQHLVFGC